MLRILIIIQLLLKAVFMRNTGELVPVDESSLSETSPTNLVPSFDYIDTNDFNEGDGPGDCKRLDFIVNFKEIGWEKWILYPRAYNAYRCSGSCAAPLNVNTQDLLTSTTNPQVTNHAQLMSIIEYNENSGRKMTNCVPTKLKPLKVIYTNEFGEIDMKEYENMIVQQCGCR